MCCFCCLLLLNLMTLSSGPWFCADRSGKRENRTLGKLETTEPIAKHSADDVLL